MVLLLVQSCAVSVAIGLTIYAELWLATVGTVICLLAAGVGFADRYSQRGRQSCSQSKLHDTSTHATALVGLLTVGPVDPLASWTAQLRWALTGFAAFWVLSLLLDGYYSAGQQHKTLPIGDSVASAEGKRSGDVSTSKGRPINRIDALSLVAYPLAVFLYQIPAPSAFAWSTLLIVVVLISGMVHAVLYTLRFGYTPLVIQMGITMAWLWLGLTLVAQIMVACANSGLNREALCWGWFLTGSSGQRLLWLTVVRRRWRIADGAFGFI